MENKELIYELLSGVLALDKVDNPLKDQIENEFAEGKACAEMYKKVYEAKCRLNERLGTSEDEDVELIIDQMFDIAKYLSMKMFDYGKTE